MREFDVLTKPDLRRVDIYVPLCSACGHYMQQHLDYDHVYQVPNGHYMSVEVAIDLGLRCTTISRRNHPN